MRGNPLDCHAFTFKAENCVLWGWVIPVMIPARRRNYFQVSQRMDGRIRSEGSRGNIQLEVTPLRYSEGVWLYWLLKDFEK